MSVMQLEVFILSVYPFQTKCDIYFCETFTDSDFTEASHLKKALASQYLCEYLSLTLSMYIFLHTIIVSVQNRNHVYVFLSYKEKASLSRTKIIIFNCKYDFKNVSCVKQH